MAETDTKAAMPHSVEELEAITHIPTTEGTTSFGNFMNRHIKADNFTELTPEQAWCVIAAHRVWQSSDERKAEKEALKAAKAQEDEAKRVAREEAKAEREQKAAEKKAETERKKAEREAKKAAEADSDEDLDAIDEVGGEGTDEIPAKTTRRRRKPKVTEDEDQTADVI